MLELAVSEIGISPKEFWSLSWYEWGLYLLRLQRRAEKEKFQWEEEWDRARRIWAAIINGYPPKQPVSPQDLIKLDRDGDYRKEVMTPERMKEIEILAKKRFGSKLKKRGE